MAPEDDWTVDFNMSFFLGGIVKDVGNCGCGRYLASYSAFLTKEWGIQPFIGLWLRQRKSISKIDIMKRFY